MWWHEWPDRLVKVVDFWPPVNRQWRGTTLREFPELEFLNRQFRSLFLSGNHFLLIKPGNRDIAEELPNVTININKQNVIARSNKQTILTLISTLELIWCYVVLYSSAFNRIPAFQRVLSVLLFKTSGMFFHMHQQPGCPSLRSIQLIRCSMACVLLSRFLWRRLQAAETGISSYFVYSTNMSW